jgi:hypothetical protein
MIADRAHVPAWQLDDAPLWWVERIATALRAENGAERERKLRDERRQRAQAASGRR